MRQRVDLGRLAHVAIDAAQARESVLAVDVHRARPADALTAGAAEGECRVDFILDLDERIENLWGLSEMSVFGRGSVLCMGCGGVVGC